MENNGVRTETATALATVQPKAMQRHDTGALGNLVDQERFLQLQRVASLMGSSALTPKHLKGMSEKETVANCFRVVNQAMRWEFDPFAVADETYVVHGRLGYQGKLIAGVINARAGLEKRLRAEYSGSGENRTVTVIGQFKGEDFVRDVSLTLKQARTDNKMWQTDPDQKLWYSGVIKWARRHCPELILGVLSEEDLETMAADAGGEQQTRLASIDAKLTLPETKAAGEKPPEAAKPPVETVKPDGEVVTQTATHPADRDALVDQLKAAILAAKDDDALESIRQQVRAVEDIIGADYVDLLLETIDGKMSQPKRDDDGDTPEQIVERLKNAIRSARTKTTLAALREETQSYGKYIDARQMAYLIDMIEGRIKKL